VEVWLHSLKVAQLLRSAACLHTNQSRSYLNHLVFTNAHSILQIKVKKMDKLAVIIIVCRNLNRVHYHPSFAITITSSFIYTSFYVSNQRNAVLSSLFIVLQNHSTCFGCHLHPSSGVHKTVVTTTGTSHVYR